MRRHLQAVSLVLVGFALGVATTSLLPNAEADPDLRARSPYARLDTFAKVMSYIERSYVDPVDQGALVEAAIKGMVGHLDPHSAYLNPTEYRAIREETDGAFVGIGVEIGLRDGYVQIVAPLEGAPAQQAGVLPGDLLVSVAGTTTRGLSLREIIGKLKGKAGTMVDIEILRLPPREKPGPITLEGATRKTFRLERRVIDVVSVSQRMTSNNIGLVRIRAFQQGVGNEVRVALAELEKTNDGRPLKGLILDLRSNPGGLLNEAVEVADIFLDKGVVVTTENRGKQRVERFEATSGGTVTSAPMVVLIDGGSASASEIVAGAMKDHRRATIIGVKSFGKGSVQSIIDMKDGSGLKLTTARYFTPNHRTIHDVGIEPDIAVTSRTRATKKGEPWYAGDAQLARAVKHLRKHKRRR